MNKIDRLAFLKNRHASLFGVAVVGLLPVSRSEIKDEARAVKSRVSASMDDSTASGDEVSLSSQLNFDAPVMRAERESDVLLTHEERTQLAREMPKREIAREIPIETEQFVGQDVPDFVPAIPKEWDAELDLSKVDAELNLVE